MSPSPGVLVLDGVSHRFATGLQALSAVRFEVAEGEFVALIGPSGCGKSTILRIAAGLTEPTTGRVAVDRSSLGFTFQDPTLLPWRTVLGNTELLLEVRGVDPGERRRRAGEALDRVGLSGFERARPDELSGGMRMRAALARWLTLQPRLYLFDEPFAALDEITRGELDDMLLSLHARHGFSALFVTHSIAEAVYLASRVIVLGARPGAVAAEVTVPFERPRSAALRFDPRFAALCADVSAALRDATAERRA